MLKILNHGPGNNKAFSFDCLENQFASFHIFSAIPYLSNSLLTSVRNAHSFPWYLPPYNLS